MTHDEQQGGEEAPLPYTPVRDGFVFSNDEIETYMARQDHRKDAQDAFAGRLCRYAAA